MEKVMIVQLISNSYNIMLAFGLALIEVDGIFVLYCITESQWWCICMVFFLAASTTLLFIDMSEESDDEKNKKVSNTAVEEE